MNNEATYTISGKNSDPGVWGFAFSEKVEAENFASMVTKLSFEAYKLTGNLVGFTGCEGLVMYMFETSEGERGRDQHKLIAAFCAGKMTMNPTGWGGETKEKKEDGIDRSKHVMLASTVTTVKGEDAGDVVCANICSLFGYEEETFKASVKEELLERAELENNAE